MLHRVVTLATAGVPEAVEIGPDAKVIVAATTGGELRAWSAPSWQPLTGLAASNDRASLGANGLVVPAFSPNGNLFLNMGGYNSQSGTLWNAATDQGVVVSLTNSVSGGSPTAAALGPHGLMGVIYSDGSVALMKGSTGQPVATLATNGGFGSNNFADITSVSPDGRSIAEGNYAGTISLWDTVQSSAVVLAIDTQFNNTSDPIDSVAFSPDSQTIAGGSDGGIIRVWQVSTKRLVSTFTLNTPDPSGAAAHPVRTLVFSPDGKSLLAADNVGGAVTVWDVASGRKIATLTAPSGNIASAAFTTQGALLVATTSSRPSGQGLEIWSTGKSLASVLPRS